MVSPGDEDIVSGEAESPPMTQTSPNNKNKSTKNNNNYNNNSNNNFARHKDLIIWWSGILVGSESIRNKLIYCGFKQF